MTTLVGLFDHYNNADWAIEVLENYDMDSEHISILARDKEIEPGMAASTRDTTASVVNLLSNLSSFAFVAPEIGPIIVTGTLAVALFTTIGLETERSSGLLTVLVDLGFSKEEAEFYAEGVKQGNILMAVETGLQDESRVQAILRGAGAMDMKTYHQIWQNEDLNALDETEKVYEETYSN